MKKRGYTIVIMSNSADVLMDVNRKALGNLFEHAILAQESKAFKPSLKFFKYVHKKLDFDHNNHTHIAQGVWADIFAATQMGWNKIWVNRDQERPSSEFEPYHVVSNLSQTLDYLPFLNEDENDRMWMIIGCIGVAISLIILVVSLFFAFRQRKKEKDFNSVSSASMINDGLLNK